MNIPFRDSDIQMYMDICVVYANRSRDKRDRVGAVLVKDGALFPGYNGTPPGWDNTCQDQNGITLPEVLHAEENAIGKCLRLGVSPVGAILFTTRAPCAHCAKLILISGIREVHYLNDYRDSTGLAILQRAGVKIAKVQA